MAESVNIIIAKIEGNRNNVPKIFKNVAQILFFINISFCETKYDFYMVSNMKHSL